jgi:hypothetical protein
VLFHASIPADDPERVARVIAELWQGEVLPFPPHPSALMVFAGDDRRTILEVFPRGLEHVPAPGEFALRARPDASKHSEVHLAMATRLTEEQVLVIADREGWLAQRSDRGGLFAVVELWVENNFLLELLCDAEQKRYVENLTIDSLRPPIGGTR